MLAGISSYVNTSAQVWTYRNKTDNPIAIDINFSNLAAGQELAYVFGNGYSASSSFLPSAGQAANEGSSAKTAEGTSQVAQTVVQGELQDLQQGQDRWRQEKSKSDSFVIQALQQVRSNSSTLAAPAIGSSSASSAANTSAVTRIWTETFAETPTDYPTALKAECLDGDGRRVKFWADEASIGNGIVNKKATTALKATLCGVNGAVSRLGRLIGKVWSPVLTRGLIYESAGALQDINVAIVSAGTEAGWAGYFSGANSFLKSPYAPDSNEALVFFINADFMKVSLNYTQSMLIHELTHMIHFHERYVLNPNAPELDTWLEEMLAMMSEDIVTPVLVKDDDDLPYQPILDSRIASYMNTGGGVNMVRWAEITKANPFYSMAGSFGAYLNRQYGLSIYKDLARTCLNLENAWDCLDSVIKKNGGNSADEEFNQFGLAVFGLGDSSGPSRKFSFPRKEDGGYVLAGIELSSLIKARPEKAATLNKWSTGMHSYFIERANFNIFTFTRRNITIPPRSQLNIMVRQRPAD